MKCVSFYHRESGLFNGYHFSTSDESIIALNTPADHIAIDGHHDYLSKRVDLASGQVVDYQPPKPSSDHEWSDENRRWQLTAAANDRAARRLIAANRIKALEAAQGRALREHALGISSAGARLQAIDDEISSLRSQL